MRIRIALALVSVVLVCGAAAAWSHFHRADAERTETAQSEENAAPADSRLVVLTDQKRASLRLRVEPAAVQPMPDIRLVPGRIQYNDTRHVEIKAAAGGNLIQVRASPGDRVAAGQVLAVVSSPEVGTARADVHHSWENWQLAVKRRDWNREISQNSFALIEALKARLPINEIEKRFQGKTLGKAREQLISAYSRLLLAETLSKNAQSLGADIVSARTMQERLAERRSAEASLTAACEQAGFDVSQAKAAAEIDAEDAALRLNIAREHLTTLLGYVSESLPAEHPAPDEVLSRVEIRAPFAGSIEQRHFAQAERVRTSDTLFVLADTSTMWVAADIREHDWPALALAPGQEISVAAPALPGRDFKARIRYVGRQVVPETNAVPIVAELPNPDGLLRPGLFVHVSLAIGAPRKALCVPAASIVQHEGVKFLFVQEDQNTFRRVDVETGAQTDDCVEIVRGIKEGAPVIVQGTADLKSELLVGSLKKED